MGPRPKRVWSRVFVLDEDPLWTFRAGRALWGVRSAASRHLLFRCLPADSCAAFGSARDVQVVICLSGPPLETWILRGLACWATGIRSVSTPAS